LALPILASITPDEFEISLTDDNVGQRIDYEEETDLVVISAFTPQAQRAYEIADEYRRRGTKVIIGGIHASGAPEETKRHADSVGIGEAELVWGDILNDMKKGELKEFYKGNTDRYNLKEFPIPKREIFPRDVYTWEAHLVLTTRGCPVRCEGCPVPHKEGIRLRMRPVECVIEDIKSMPYKEFYVIDDTVMIPGKKSINYMKKFTERTKDLDVSIFLSSTMMMVSDPEFYRALKKGGVSSMYTVFGFDRASKALFSKDCTKEEWQSGVDLVRMIEDAGIHFFASYGIGFDDQDEGTPDRILKFSEEAGIDLAEFYIHTPFPGTPFGDVVEKEDRVLHRNYHLWNTGNVVFRPKHFTPDGLQQAFYYLWNEFYKDKVPQRTLRSFELNKRV
ncbi:MAG: B12-binding domain-containing radical SAM protein, partial [Chitinivibrionales bacterium]